MSLVKTVRAWPADWATCAVYRKGHTIQVEGRKPEVSDGKRPINGSHHEKISPARTALKIEQYPDIYKAAGVFTGPRSGGLVVLDVDSNLGALQLKWGKAELDKAPQIRSTKKNACKYLFQIPQDLWTTVADVSHAAAGQQGFEILWGRMAVLQGAYPGSNRYSAPEGEYTLEGDLEAIPEAPEWLLAIMQESKADKDGRSSQLTGSKKVDLYRNWSWEQRYEICRACLSVIPPEGGGEDLWWRVGAMVHAAGLGDKGLELWEEWSKRDSEYDRDWEKGNPCSERWDDFNENGGYTIRSLIGLANEYDPEKRRFRGNDLERLVAETEAATVTIRQAQLSFDEIIERGMRIYEGDDVARMNYELHALAMEARYKDQSGIEKLLLDHITQQNRSVGCSMENREETRREYLVPGLLPQNYTVLFFGEAGCGKSATAMALMKHVVDGIPFQLKNQLVPVQQGPVVYFNADMSFGDFTEEYDLHEIKNGKDFHFEPDFNLYKRVQFVKTMNRIKPKMICIDSLSSCSGAKAGDENKAEFAQPLYWLNTNNGTLWPECTILVLHHAAKHGGARGSSSITAAVAEVWNISKPKQDSGLATDQRVITIGKSRINRSGETLIQTQNEDLTVSIVESKRPEEMQTRAGTVAERIMNRLQTSKYPMTRTDLNADPLVGGSIAAIKKTLQRLENRGVLEVTERPSPKGPVKLYSALRAWGESVKGGQTSQTPCNDSKTRGDTSAGTSTCPPTQQPAVKTRGDNSKAESKCPPTESSAGAGSDPGETLSLYPRAREERSVDELAKLNDEAWKAWD